MPVQRASCISISMVAMRANARDLSGGHLDETREALIKAMDVINSVQQSKNAVPMDPNTAREQQLWDRQQAMYDRMLQQWDAERQVWQQREATLLQQIEGLQQQLMQLMWQQQQQQRGSMALPSSGPPPAALPASTAESSRDAQGTPISPGAAAVAAAMGYSPTRSEQGSDSWSPQTPSSRDASRQQRQQSAGVAAGATAAASAAGTSAASDASWADLFAGQSGASSFDGADDEEGSSTASSPAAGPGAQRKQQQHQLPKYAREIAAAISLVDRGDVLTDDLDLGAIARAGRREDQQAPAAAPATAAAPAAAAASAAAAAAAPETVRGSPDGPPPLLSAGDDDIFWVSKLHAALEAAGCYPPDHEVEDFYFGEGTQAALLCFQALNGLDETGVTDDETWSILMGDDAPDKPPVGASATAGSDGVAAHHAGNQQQHGKDGGARDAAEGASSGGEQEAGAEKPRRSKWPVVMDQDGGREVHALHVALSRHGFYCGDDDMQWWMFGDSTMMALRTYQASAGLAESGVCDESTWLALLGGDAHPSLVDELRHDDPDYEMDLGGQAEGALWLLGEQRWSRPV